jgi:AraC family transcriptional regulator
VDDPHGAAFEFWSRLGRVRCFVEEHIDETLSAGRAAAIAGLERRYFSAYFRQRVGIGYHCWLETVRIDRAKRLLAQDDRPVTEVSLDVGFGDLGTFERAFRRRVGQTPREYRRGIEPFPRSLPFNRRLAPAASNEHSEPGSRKLPERSQRTPRP